MLENIFRVSKEKVLGIPRIDDYLESDRYLRSLGPIDQPIIVFNPVISDQEKDLIYWVDDLSIADKCLILNYNNICVAKIFPPYWNSNLEYYEEIVIKKPQCVWKKNLDLDKLMKFKNDPFDSYNLSPWDKDYELVWYLDPRVNPLDDKIWALSCRPSGRKIKGIKNMGYVMPDINVEFNQELPEFNFDIDSNYPNYWDLEYENVFELDSKHHNKENLWAVKYTPNYRKPKGWKVVDSISPKMEVTYNPALGNLNYTIDHNFLWHDFEYEHVWLLDRQYIEEGQEDIWAFKIKFSNSIKGSKIVGYIGPEFTVKYNPNLGKLNYEIENNFLWHDFAYEHTWLLDKKYLHEGEEDIWAFKIIFNKKPQGIKIMGYIDPVLNIEYNPDLGKLNYEIEHNFLWHDFAYEHTWLLDRKHLQEGEEDIWAIKYSFAEKIKGFKNLGYISPKLTINTNKSLPNFNYKIDYVVPWHDLLYKHVWYLDSKYSNKRVWAITVFYTDTVKGEKEVGTIVPIISEKLDVIFISYSEPNAEKNWQRVLEKAPWAKRVHGVKGIFNAHKAAAKLSKTDMFYVVDGDAYLVDDWKFDYQPKIFDRDCAYVWSSQNPVNGLTYGYGGVKLFSKKILTKKKTWDTLDMFTGIMPKIKVEEKISCVTMFDVDEFSTWRSAFRECVKLYMSNQTDRLKIWTTKGKNKTFGKYAIEGANDAIIFAKQNLNNRNELLKINDYEWLKKRFEEKYYGRK